MDNFLDEYCWALIGAIVVLLLLLFIVINFIQDSVKKDNTIKESDNFVKVSKSLYTKLVFVKNEKDKLDIDYSKLESKYFNLKQDYDKLCLEISELRRTNSELNELNDKGNVASLTDNNSGDKHSGETKQETVIEHRDTSVQDQYNKGSNSSNHLTNMLMYASFPRSAGNKMYFSDLTEKITDDSFFEISFLKDKEKATFKPLDFLRIRNYDDAMIAMRTEGAKPNVASTVISIEPGTAHLEGKDWIIDKQANIKLA